MAAAFDARRPVATRVLSARQVGASHMAAAFDARNRGVARSFEDKRADVNCMAEARRQATATRAQQAVVRRCRRRSMNLYIFKLCVAARGGGAGAN
jgi:hypothetical protein